MASDDKLKLETNIPETIALEFDRGLPVSGNYGDQVLFTLCDGRKWYVPPFVASKVEAAGIPAGVAFSICKREIVEGNRRRVEYQIGDAVSSAVPAPVATPAPIQRQRDEGHAAAATAYVQSPAINPASNLNQLQTQHTARPAAAATPVEGKSVVALLTMAGCGAIDAVLQIEQYAQDRGLTDFSFGVENVQKMAVTLFLELSRKAGRA